MAASCSPAALHLARIAGCAAAAVCTSSTSACANKEKVMFMKRIKQTKANGHERGASLKHCVGGQWSRGGEGRLLRTSELGRATLSGDVLSARVGSETPAINDMRYFSVSRFGRTILNGSEFTL